MTDPSPKETKGRSRDSLSRSGGGLGWPSPGGDPDPGIGTTRWTCPFCALLCDGMHVRPGAAGSAWELVEGACAAAPAGLARFGTAASNATPTLDGRPCEPAAALAAAASVLAASRQPLFGGLGTDVAGARALYRLTLATGAICDPAGGAALMHGVRALQDRGGFTTTLAEVRARADLIVWLGPLPKDGPAKHRANDFFARCGRGTGLVARPHVVVLGESAEAAAALAALAGAPEGSVEAVPAPDDLLDTVAMLAGVVAGRAVRDVPAALAALAERLARARYAVIVGDAGRLPAHGALLIETVNRIVETLNHRTRAAALWLGADNGAATVNQVFTWLSGLPLRSRAGPLGLEHEPVCFDAARLLADAAVDSLLWVESFDPDCVPPATSLPLVVIGHPALAASAARPGAVFIPVSTPGIGSAGHLFRADGGVVLPLAALYRDTLPGVADVLGALTSAVQAAKVPTEGRAAPEPARTPTSGEGHR